MEKRPKIKEKQRGSGLKRRLVSFFIIAVSVLFLVFAPRFFIEGLGGDEYFEWMKLQREPPVEVIKVWHVVGLRPFVGSLGNMLKSYAEKYSERFIGIYFEVKTYTQEAAREQLERGNLPDLISFSTDMYPIPESADLSSDGLEPFYAVPYCCSKSVIVYANGADPVPDENGTPELFKRGKCKALICDVRTAGDLYRAQLLGKCPAFCAAPADEPPIAQYLGILAGTDEAKLPYAKGFIDFVLSREAQDRLCGLGLFPIDSEAKTEFETDWLTELYGSIDLSLIPSCF